MTTRDGVVILKFNDEGGEGVSESFVKIDPNTYMYVNTNHVR